ncbi:uncharacterized protein BO96DRAFT_401907 [Aspergillus niger CBS 101883]|uniref:uncharacterized protein n=1 Tax=Aspergillus lacticoffeatus (strain CBS 101883) TaxID=1450533 RepID=UPI000D7EB997|nr:uncharacterized protein BO96DRAFT_401907 [Aspergillus niger CBS 101883]PYH52425.1 hypothetical protein BO96DRAFT_401907 [Aspergillus niger CBS 101883]
MTPPVDEVRAGFVVSVAQAKNKDGDPTVFSATQIPTVNSLPLVPPPSTRSTQSIDFSSGPVKVIGYIDTNSLEVGVRVEVFGAHIFNLYGNVREGVVGKIELFLAKGEIRLYLKNGNEVWLHYDIEVSFDGHFKDDVHLLTI